MRKEEKRSDEDGKYGERRAEREEEGRRRGNRSIECRKE